MDRRDFLKFGAAGVGAAALLPVTGCAPEEPTPSTPFSSGVASGLHSDTAVVLWTRVDPRVATPTSITWEISTSDSMSPVIATGSVDVDPAHDSCVKVLVSDLPSNSSFWYRFRTNGFASDVGRARTLPSDGDPSATSLRLAFASCQHFSAGFYQAWKSIAEQDLDAVLFLGDYIYELGMGPIGVRWEPFSVTKTLAEYHSKYRLYRTDENLRAAHAAHPLLPIWDDHEVFNDHDRDALAADPVRANAAHQAWFDYMPVWPIDGTQIYRSLRWGSLAELTMLDTRQYRDGHFPSQILGTFLDTNFANPNRTILGARQRDWLFDTLSAAQADGVTWKLIGNQVMIAPIRYIDLDTPQLRALAPDLVKHAGFYSSTDSWDGFPAERDNLLAHIADNGVENVNFLTGDVHAFFTATVRQDFDDVSTPLVANEFTVSSISSTQGSFVEAAIEASNNGRLAVEPGFEFTDLYHNGFATLHATTDAMTIEYFSCSARIQDVPVQSATFTVTAGTPGLTRN